MKYKWVVSPHLEVSEGPLSNVRVASLRETTHLGVSDLGFALKNKGVGGGGGVPPSGPSPRSATEHEQNLI